MSNVDKLQDHKFFRLPRTMQLAIAFAMLILAFLILFYWMSLVINNLWFLLTLPLLIFVSPLIEKPISILSGAKTYFSPLLVVWGRREHIYQMHLGTLFDYMMVLDFKSKGQTFKTQILVYTFQGVLNIIDEIKRTENFDSKVLGTSYFLSKSTAERFNFKTLAASPFQILLMLVNYVNLVFLLSIVDRKLRFPNIFQAMKVEIDAHSLLQEEEKIRNFYNYMRSRLEKAKN